MVHNPDRVYNQYSMRDIIFPYGSERFIRTPGPNSVDASSATMGLKMHAIEVLAQRSAILSSALLLPWHHELRPNGVRYWNITVPVIVLWGAQDNMMPELQRYRFLYAMTNNRNVRHKRVADAGHFAGTDHPKQVAEDIINFVIATQGRSITKTFFGFTGIWKGDEALFADVMNRYLARIPVKM